MEKESISPKKFAFSFTDLEGNPTRFGEQKDAFEFLCQLLDKVEDKVKTSNSENIIKDNFEGYFANELFCQDCSHYYEREEKFLGVTLIVKNIKNIQKSFEHLVESQTLDGDNAYFCEKCQIKVKAHTRVTFKTLPNYLILALNRFEYDFEAGVREKINDYYEFTQEIDLEPFTQSAMKNKEKLRGFEDKPIRELTRSKSFVETQSQYLYDLKGVVIHDGGTEFGHYYSLIKDQDKWLEFNDSLVTEFDMKRFPDVAFGDNKK